MLKKAKVSPLQAFEYFDKDGNGNLDRNEFFSALEQLNLHDMTQNEFRILWDALDTDKNDEVDYKEFCTKLERFGVRKRTKEEAIIFQIVEAVNRSQVQDLSHLFQLIDKNERGFISKQDFRELFDNLQLKLKEEELDAFINNFWRDKGEGIDYPGFLKIFEKYKVKLNAEVERNKPQKEVIVPDTVVILKKEVFDKIQHALEVAGKDIISLFRKIDADNSSEIDRDEFYDAFKQMKLDVEQYKVFQIFDSIDFDGSNGLSIPELVADFRNTV